MGEGRALEDALGIAAREDAARGLRVGERDALPERDGDSDADADLEGSVDRDTV